MPAHIDLTALLPELSGMNCSSVLNGMARAVNARALLELCRCRGEGRLVLGVTDSIIPENNRSFALCFAPGQPNQVEPTNEAPDVTLDVGDLAVLLGGARDGASLAYTLGVQVHRPSPALGQVFYSKPCHILDLF